ncbi:MAG: hypothetical protein K2X62_12570 [Beijerinckiaceae bacterium]|jgi:hypothetical protein|nr:hypothetical protein [Beijerinckiaceae bacterium]MDO9440563.1 hypothetical protein [Beijerinckiaceae bacterium]
MRKLIWGGTWFLLALWSLLAWASHSLVEWAGQLAARNSDMVTGHPETVEWLSWAANAAGVAGGSIVIVIWAIGCALALGLAAILSRLVGSREPTYRQPLTRP